MIEGIWIVIYIETFRWAGSKTETQEFEEFTKTPAWGKIVAELREKGLGRGF